MNTRTSYSTATDEVSVRKVLNNLMCGIGKASRKQWGITWFGVVWLWIKWWAVRRHDERYWKPRFLKYAEDTGLIIGRSHWQSDARIAGLPPWTWKETLMFLLTPGTPITCDEEFDPNYKKK